jgi:hypothetical protein
MKSLVSATMLLFVTTLLSAADTPKTADATVAFAHLKSLAGDWEAKNPAGGKSRVHYDVVSAGSAVVERFEDDSMGAGNAMLTVYYLDGGRLLLTHYCMAKNQPRMQAEAFDNSTGELRFAFLDATGLATPEAGHMHSATFHFVDADHFSTAWQFFDAGKPKMTETAQYARVQ